MSRHILTRTIQAGQHSIHGVSLGARLRALREKKDLPLWKVAAEAQMDSTLLSKIELGQRLPTVEQTTALGKFFDVAATELESMRIAQKFLSENGHNPAAAALALTRIQEIAGEYLVNTKRAMASKPVKPVNTLKKKG